MKTKNISLFRRRANAHALAGHIAQGTYGEGRTNGTTEYKGCFVGCLTTPHTKRGLRSFVKSHLKKFSGGRPGFQGLTNGSGALRRKLADEFGLCLPLIVLIEGFFEAQRTHKQAINFIPDVAAALNEGADIRPAAVQAFVNELGLERRTPRTWSYTHHMYIDGVGKPLNIKSTEYHRVMVELRKGNVPAQTKKFLAWLEAQKPVAS